MIGNLTREDEMAAFDQLDPRLREFIRNLPGNFPSFEALAMQQMRGVEETLRMGQRMLETNFPGWTPI
jgi:hypothetical protein